MKTKVLVKATNKVKIIPLNKYLRNPGDYMLLGREYKAKEKLINGRKEIVYSQTEFGK